MQILRILAGLGTGLLLTRPTLAIDLDVNSEDSLKNAASIATYGAFTYYSGNDSGGIPGAFPSKWYEGSALFIVALNYWHYTGDDTYNAITAEGLEWQSGPQGDYMPTNYSQFLGNDDQMFWGIAAITAAEMNLPQAPSSYGTWDWLALAEGVFRDQTSGNNVGWDTTACGGGVRWQKFFYQGGGYYMKNSISNGGLFQLVARLYRYTGNSEYKDWAEKIWNWSVNSPLVNNQTWNVADSTQMQDDCTSQGNTQFSYNYGTYLMGCAYMYNSTTGAEQEQWATAVYGLANKTLETFFLEQYNYVMFELSCDGFIKTCFDSNNFLMKGWTTSWLALTATLVPQTYSQILPKLQASAGGAAKACSGSTLGGNECGESWVTGSFDGRAGMEPEISAGNCFAANLIAFNNNIANGPLTQTTGGNSKGNPNAGKNGNNGGTTLRPITTGDRAGAGILTVGFVAGWVALMAWLVLFE
ncbi:uncharacterized protein PFLUO_LOCUS6988 [Penicillium psychrofluorescens]|uniref:uncharacterized protein n=1 Tax=Penicillium psychrofluorescens TaxID=3158075 RepID=UPI003CCDEC85